MKCAFGSASQSIQPIVSRLPHRKHLTPSRPGCSLLFETAHKFDVPLLIFSAGLSSKAMECYHGVDAVMACGCHGVECCKGMWLPWCRML